MMTGTEDSGTRGNAFPSPPPAGFLDGATITALLAIITSFLPGIPAAHAQTPGSTRLEVAEVADGTAYHKWSDDNGASWSFWTRLDYASGAWMTGAPAVVSDGFGRLNVFALALSDPTDPSSYNGLWQNLSIDGNGSWSGWMRVPGNTSGNICDAFFGCFVPASSPAVASWGPGRMDLFVNGYSAQWGTALLHSWADNYSWSGTWEVLSFGDFRGAPAAASWGPGRFDIFMNYDSALAHLWFDNGQWYPNGELENLGSPPNGGITSPPAAASPGSGRLNIFARGSDGHLWGIWFAGGWGGWGDTGCCLAGDVTNSVAATSRSPLTLDVFVTGTLHDLYRKDYDYYSGGWADWQYLDQVFNYTNIAATAWVPVAPPPPAPTPPPNPTHQCGMAGQPPCVLPQ